MESKSILSSERASGSDPEALSYRKYQKVYFKLNKRRKMINKVFDEKYNFWKLTCDDTEVISSWNEGEDITNYSSFKIAYCPKDADLDVYHTFTAEQDEMYTKQREEEERKRHPEPEAKENKENE